MSNVGDEGRPDPVTEAAPAPAEAAAPQAPREPSPESASPPQHANNTRAGDPAPNSAPTPAASAQAAPPVASTADASAAPPASTGEAKPAAPPAPASVEAKPAAPSVAGAAEAKPAAPAAAAPKHAPAPPAPPKPAPVPWTNAMVEELKSVHGEAILKAESFLGQNYLVVDRSVCHQVIERLRNQFGYTSLTDISALHYPKDELPFEMFWILYSMAKEDRVRIKARFAESDEVQSITDLWVGANWLEREVYDMFGLRFAGHPDLRRILMPEGWAGHPLRKDYGAEQQDTAWVQKNLGIESGQ